MYVVSSDGVTDGCEHAASGDDDHGDRVTFAFDLLDSGNEDTVMLIVCDGVRQEEEEEDEGMMEGGGSALMCREIDAETYDFRKGMR